VSVNGAVIGRDLLSNMSWPFEDLVTHAARGTWVRAGDVLGSGTCGNGGCLAELWGLHGHGNPPPLKPGDIVEGIGTIRNRVVPGASLPAPRTARKRPRDRSAA
jgi:2-keto-4-pentenoate hydratase/2-oxohepta-3-ene-1,7-dioic acid hydratase in catechol pathway